MSHRMYLFIFLLCFLCVLCASVVNSSSAHPVPALAYDRVIQVKLTPAGVEVAYQLNVDEITIFRDVKRIVNEDKRRTGNEIRAAFRNAMAPLLADRLEATLDGKPLAFDYLPPMEAEPKWIIEDHVKYDFKFVAKWPLPIAPGQVFKLQETNFENQKGQVDLAYAPEQQLAFRARVEPDAALKAKPSVERTSREEQQLRSLSATIAATEPAAPLAPGVTTQTEPTAAKEPSLWQQVNQRGPVALLDSSLGFWLVLLLLTVWGAAHALTPGHGKTLVASYLVGERGTVAHAFLLGLVTTITHTGMVLLISIVLWLGIGVSPQQMQTALGFVGGLLIAGLGLWLLLRRLAGQADHFHIGGGHHHHDGEDHHHHAPLPADGEKVRIWNLIVLGIGGGLIPCWDAITIQVAVMSQGQLWLGPPLILAFSIGLAATLVAVGVAVVKLKGFGASRWGQGRLIKSLPFVSALAIIGIGIWLCLDSIPK